MDPSSGIGVSTPLAQNAAGRLRRHSLAAAALALAVALTACSKLSELPQEPVALAPGETHVYRLSLPAEHFIEVTAGTRQLDLQVTAVAPAGEVLTETWMKEWRWRAETLAVTSTTAGVYELQIHGLTRDEVAAACGRPPHAELGSQTAETVEGTYLLDLKVKRPATPGDRAVSAASRELAAGAALAQCEGEESRQAALARLREGLERLPAAEQAAAFVVAERAKAHHWIGLVQLDLQQQDAALASLQRALELRRRLGASGRLADTLYRLGEAHRRRGEYRKALDFYQQALSLYSDLGERQLEAFTQVNLGFLNKQLTRLHDALDHYLPALRLLRELGLKQGELTTLTNIGSAYQALGDVERASEYFAEALPLSRQLSQHASEAAILNHIGWGLKARGEARQALQWLDGAVRLGEKLDDGRRLAHYLDNLGRAHLMLGELEDARRHVERALGLSRDRQDRSGQALRHISLAMIHRAAYEARMPGDPERDDLEQAGHHLIQALEMSRALEDRRNEAEALRQQALLARTRGDLETAQGLAAAAVTVVEEVLGEIAGRDLLASYLGLQRSVYELHVDLLMALAAAREDRRLQEAAFTAHERARARGLLRGLAAEEDRSEAAESLLERERTLRSELNRLEAARLGLGEDRPEPPGSLRARIRDLRRELEGLVRQIDGYAAARELPSDLKDVQNQVVDRDSLLLEYALGDERSFLFAVTAQSLDVHVLPARAEIEAAARQVYGLLSDPATWNGASTPHRQRQESYREEAGKLSALLLGPVAERLTGQRLLVAAEGSLRYLPFAALPDPHRGQDRPLLLQHEVVHLPSASVLATLRRRLGRRPPAQRLLAVLADPVFAADDPRVTGASPTARDRVPSTALRSARDSGLVGFERLTSSAREAEEIARLVTEVAPGGDLLLAVGFDASSERATDGELERFQILHFATHGLLNNRHPELSGLVLSLIDEHGQPQDGFLRLHEIERLKLQADLVVLSACRTALGRQVRGEGLLGLTRGFFQAGAKRVLASLWRVEDRATAELMVRFYRGLLERRLPAATALRQAQIELHRGDAGRRFRSPYHWAAFVLQGEWRGFEEGTALEDEVR